MTFVGPPPKGTEACHNNSDKTDNRLSNLRWDTRRNNVIDAANFHCPEKGSLSNVAKLSAYDIPAIRALLYEHYSTVYIGRLYDVAPSTIEHIADGATWFHV